TTNDLGRHCRASGAIVTGGPTFSARSQAHTRARASPTSRFPRPCRAFTLTGMTPTSIPPAVRALAMPLVAMLVALLAPAALLGADDDARPKRIGVGAPPPEGADVLLDGTRKTLDEKWTYWEGPGFKSSLPIKWPMVEDP